MQLPTSHRREVVEDILDIKIFSIMNLLLKQHFKSTAVEISDLSVNNRLDVQNKNLQQNHLGNIEETSSKRIKGLSVEKEGYQNDLAIKRLEVENLEEKITTLIHAGTEHDKMTTLKILMVQLLQVTAIVKEIRKMIVMYVNNPLNNHLKMLE